MPKLVSLIIDNYNNERFLRQAIESAVSQSYSPLEVIIVDDGSTDGSRSIIEDYRDRAEVILKENGGQASAINAGFAASHGEIVMFLDSDDYLYSDAVATIVTAWRDGISKVQFRLSVVDAEGTWLGVNPPRNIPMPQGDVVPALLRTGRYVCSGTHANAYSRSVLEKFFPIPEDEFRNTADGYFNPLCPFYGPIISIDAEFGAYRQHGENQWAFASHVTAAGLRRKIRYQFALQRYLEGAAAEHGKHMQHDYLLQDPLNVFHRLASLRLDPARHPVPGDTRLKLYRSAMSAVMHDTGTPLVDRGYQAFCVTGVAFAPLPIADWFVQLLLLSRPHPRWMRALARFARRLAARTA